MTNKPAFTGIPGFRVLIRFANLKKKTGNLSTMTEPHVFREASDPTWKHISPCLSVLTFIVSYAST